MESLALLVAVIVLTYVLSVLVTLLVLLRTPKRTFTRVLGGGAAVLSAMFGVWLAAVSWGAPLARFAVVGTLVSVAALVKLSCTRARHESSPNSPST